MTFFFGGDIDDVDREEAIHTKIYNRQFTLNSVMKTHKIPYI